MSVFCSPHHCSSPNFIHPLSVCLYDCLPYFRSSYCSTFHHFLCHRVRVRERVRDRPSTAQSPSSFFFSRFPLYFPFSHRYSCLPPSCSILSYLSSSKLHFFSLCLLSAILLSFFFLFYTFFNPLFIFFLKISLLSTL